MFLLAFFDNVYSQIINESDCFSVSQMLDKSNKDSLMITSACDVLDFKIAVYNRWGEVLHTSYSVGNIEIFKQDAGTQLRVTKKKVKRKTRPTAIPFSEGQYTWIITYFELSDIARKEQKTQNGILYITE
jgi:hypothetical protein